MIGLHLAYKLSLMWKKTLKVIFLVLFLSLDICWFLHAATGVTLVDGQTHC